jgi:hypothetical protein
LLAGSSIISSWTQGTVEVPAALLCVFAIWTSIEVVGIAFGTYLNGVGIVREQVVVVTAFCVVAVPTKVWATMQAGATGLVIATILS